MSLTIAGIQWESLCGNIYLWLFIPEAQLYERLVTEVFPHFFFFYVRKGSRACSISNDVLLKAKSMSFHNGQKPHCGYTPYFSHFQLLHVRYFIIHYFLNIFSDKHPALIIAWLQS